MGGHWKPVLLLVLVALAACIQSASVNAPVGKLLQLQRQIDAAKQETALARRRLNDQKKKVPMSVEESNAWPFDIKGGMCESVPTRDVSIEQNPTRTSSGELRQNRDCGINMYDYGSNEKRTMQKDNTKHAERKSSYQSERDQLVRLLMDYVNGQKDAWRMPDSIKSHMRSWNVVDEEAEKEKDLHSRVVGGEGAQAGQWPWLVAIGKKGSGLSCGGSLIRHNWVVTAAHCFQEEERPCSYNIRMGSLNWVQDSEGYHEDIEPELIVKHANFDADSLANDIALVKLSRSVKLDKGGYINAICVPANNYGVKVGEIAVAAGWGAEHEEASNIPETARDVELPVVDQSKCGFDITSTQLCAGYEEGGRDTCQGDSGGPLMEHRDGKWYQVGITSYGNGCARAGWPGIYTEVSAFTDFIASVIARHS